MSKRDDFIALIKEIKKASPNITNETRQGYLILARTAYGLTAQEAEKILKDVGITVGPSVNYYEVLELNTNEIKSLSNTEAEKRILEAYGERYAKVRRMPNNNPRKREIQDLLAKAKVFLIDDGKWKQHLQEIVGEVAAADNDNDKKDPPQGTRPILEFPSGERASTPEELAKLIDKHWDEAKLLLYSGSVALWLESIGERNLTIATKEITNRYRSERDIGLEEFIQKLDPQVGKPKLQMSHTKVDFGGIDTESKKTIDIQVRNVGRGFLYGEIRLSTDMLGLRISESKIRGEGVVSVKLDASQLTPNKMYQTVLVFNTNGGMVRVPVSCNIIEDINKRDKDGNTPLHHAAQKGAHQIAEVLIKKGADINLKNNNGETPLYDAAWNNAHQTAEVLLKKGADINLKNNNGRTPLHDAAWNNAHQTAEVLIKKGADVNAQNANGETPLHDAAWRNASDTAEILLKNGADVKPKDRYGRTALRIAEEYNMDNMVALLRKYGARKGWFR